MTSEFIFDRKDEQDALRGRLQQRRSFLFHGPSGAGKSLLLRRVVQDCPEVLYCSHSATMLTVLRSLATILLQRDSAQVRAAAGRNGNDALGTKTAVSLKGVVLDALRDGRYAIVLDHVNRPPSSFAATVREITGWAATPVVAVARSHHMEDVGSLHPLYPDRSDRFELRNFDRGTAQQFASHMVTRTGLTAANLDEFLPQVVIVSKGNPGAISAMLQMAAQPQYRKGEHIKTTPLQIDFRLTAAGSLP